MHKKKTYCSYRQMTNGVDIHVVLKLKSFHWRNTKVDTGLKNDHMII